MIFNMWQAFEYTFFSLHVLLGLSNCLEVWLLIRQHFEHQVRYSLLFYI